MSKDIIFENKPTVQNSMNFYKEYFKRMGDAVESRKKIEAELKNRPITGREKKERDNSINKLKNFATEYGLDPNAIGCSK